MIMHQITRNQSGTSRYRNWYVDLVKYLNWGMRMRMYVILQCTRSAITIIIKFYAIANMAPLCIYFIIMIIMIKHKTFTIESVNSQTMHTRNLYWKLSVTSGLFRFTASTGLGMGIRWCCWNQNRTQRRFWNVTDWRTC